LPGHTLAWAKQPEVISKHMRGFYIAPFGEIFNYTGFVQWAALIPAAKLLN
jgi:hypothetical protein